MPNLKPLSIALAIGAISLTGCGAAPSSPCPPLIAYDQTRLDAAAREIEALPLKSLLPDFFSDDAQLRAEIRACRRFGGAS